MHKKVCMQDDELPIVKVQDTWVGKDGILHVVEGGPSSIAPEWCNRVGELLLCNIAQRWDT